MSGADIPNNQIRNTALPLQGDSVLENPQYFRRRTVLRLTSLNSFVVIDH